jgi:hypothetical protein
MKAGRLILTVLAAALVVLAAVWGFLAYLAPEAVIDYVNQRFFCD